MNRLYFSSLLLAVALSGPAQDKLDLRTRAILSKKPVAETFDSQPLRSPLSQSKTADSVLRTIVTVDDESAIADLEAAGAEIITVIGNNVVCSIPVGNLEKAAEIAKVRNITPVQKRRLLNDKARSMTNVDAIHTGTDIDRTYLGEGVIVGLFDGGLDPNHVNFYDSDQSQNRVKRVWKYTTDDNTGNMSVGTYDTATKISGFTTDSDEDTHGTHVLGIAAGAYSKGSTDYSGMAPGAELAISCGEGYDDEILDGVEKIINYAEQQGKPCVINLSLGSNLGHHDGTDPFNVSMDKLAERAPIFIAAGNEADLDITIKKTLTSTDKEIKTFLIPNNYTSYYLGSRGQAVGNVEIIGPDASAFTVEVGLYSTTQRKIVYRLAAGDGEFKYVAGSRAGVEDYTTNSNFTNAYSTDSYIGAACAICPDNYRFYSIVDYALINKSASPTVYPVIIVTGTAGKTYELYCDGMSEFSTRGISGYDQSTPDGTINDMACARNIIAVGGYVSKNTSRPYNGEIVGDALYYSSYGTLADGRKLPHICAPGQSLVSSISRYYYNGSEYDSSYEPILARATFNGATHYWSHMGGTSMATPVMTGVAALWLEADPTLTPAEIRDIAMKTANIDSYVNNGTVATSPVQWGAGKLDAYAGIKEIILSNASVGSILEDGKSSIIITPISDRTFEIFSAGEAMTANLVNISGQTVASVAGSGTLILDASDVIPGVYILTVEGDQSIETRKIAIR